MSYEKLLSGYQGQSYGKLLERIYGNKAVQSTALVPAGSSSAPAQLVKESRAIVPSGDVSSVIGIDKETGSEITVNQKDRLEGTFVIGKTGKGKSTLIENEALQDIDNGLGVVILDPHGQLVDGILRRMDRRLEDVIIIDLGSDDYVAPFNLFHCKDAASFKEVVKIVSSFMHVLESFYDISHKNPQMNQYFTNIAKTLVHNPEYTLLDIPRLLDDEVFRKRLVANIPDVHVRWFWERFYEKYRVGVRRGDDISFVVNKLDEFINPAMMPWFGDTKMALNFRQLMDEQKIVFIKLKSEWRSSSKLMGNIFIAQLLDAAHSRSDILDEKDRKDVNIYIDEFQKFASLDLAELFTEARKYKLGLLVANQVTEMIDPIIKATCKQAANIVVFGVSPDNAEEMASFFDTTPPPGEMIYERVMRQKLVRERQTWWEPPEAEEGYNNSLKRDRELSKELDEYKQYSLPRFFQRGLKDKYKWRSANSMLPHMLEKAPEYANIQGFVHLPGEEEIEEFEPCYPGDTMNSFTNYLQLYEWEDEKAWFYTKLVCMRTIEPIFGMDWQIQQEIGSLMREWVKAVKGLGKLSLCRKSGNREVLGDWEPVRITETEFRNRHGAVQMEEVDREIYRQREGSPPYGSDEVKRRTAQTIKDLEKYTAKVKIASGEYIIKTIAPAAGLDNEALQERIAGIQERNVAAGYLRLRSDVEREILERQQPPEKQETAAAEKPRVENKPAPAAGAVDPPTIGRRGKKGS